MDDGSVNPSTSHPHAMATTTVLVSHDLFLLLTSFMPGRRAKEWTDAFRILRAGHLHLLHQAVVTSATMNAAAAAGRLDILRWLHERHASSLGWTTAAMDHAAANGHLNVVTFLHTHRHEGCTCAAMDGAAANGHLDMLQYLYHDTDAPFEPVDVLVQATEAEHYDVALWLERLTTRRPVITSDETRPTWVVCVVGHVRAFVRSWFRTPRIV
ncbi:Aste57867_19261 [Aphanomyces stellatus]|uniref:Aste57867_19261 protein n=1 Tax=Aphanomyces stellatus TaxID=120398 RepID=A0A485LCY5_9STRA|nr:hypothetical protein As57867_019197 [Aphanomyces stellatus]VFT95981.1 Aste57867_19261 [Aphanomyces stellatus]